ncbi:putative repeat protein (TIGR01451 family)/fimbrial isopeptide formation D2 family protein [Humitalea rosea]|uniref:Putative repeat protein (TIGR01451 family)/fimbrial isopeptide formation D2 family protein n=1 Tax=Humitalea rosea TaxID=990373 RepID=A0A2W7IMF0_9PROT|nr:SdrD B-like domain-containing protein [Humitalea rosea]PZW48015.1 putative repeat protein (TIGR01451 family)/fimbrial isopeptide formation D2 family protein [Humitalea rosea]
MSAQPVVTFVLDGAAQANGASAAQFIGTTRTAVLRFDNQPDGVGGDATSVGYAPYVNLALPNLGVDGNDGVTLLSASYLGVALTQQIVTFDAFGHATHPFAVTAAGAPLVITGTPGTQMVVLKLPFGSFTGDQTPADIDLVLSVSNLADNAAPLQISASGGFAFGRDEFNNPTADAPVVGAVTLLNVVPTLAALDKIYVGPEQETATGPSYPRSWLVEGDIAPGQSLTSFVLTDDMPDGTHILGASIIGPYTGTVTIVGRTITATFDGAVSAGAAKPTLKIDFYVDEFLDNGDPVLSPTTGSFRLLGNDAQLSGVWDPLDGRDPIETVVIDPAGFEDQITGKSIAVQKSVTPEGAVVPGNKLLWTLDGQVSNYFDVDHLVMTDTLGDGQHFDASVTPTIVISERGAVIYSGLLTTFNPATDVVRDGGSGISTLSFDISELLRSLGLDDALNGQTVAGANFQATAVVTFKSVIEESWTPGNKPGDQFVDQGDSLGNAIDFSGEVVDTNAPIVDDSGAGVSIPVNDVAKSIYAINGNLGYTTTKVQAGDEITFRLKLTTPLSNSHQVTLTDFLPLPVLKAADADADAGTGASFTFSAVADASVPGVGVAKLGPSETYTLTGSPTITMDSVANSLTFDFGSLDASFAGRTIDVLFTVKVVDAPFGDGLLLTNQVTSEEVNSDLAHFQDNAIVQFTLTEPKLDLVKSVVAVSSNDLLVAAAGGGTALSGVTWSTPGTGGNRFSSTINSTKLAGNPLDADVKGLDAGDTVTFAIIVENTGSGVNGAFDTLIRDSIPTGLVAPGSGINLRVTDGAGNVLTYTGDLFDAGGGLRLIDPTGHGAIAAANATSGANVVIITYDLLVQTTPGSTDVQPGTAYVNTASIVEYAAIEGGIDRTPTTPAADLSDTAKIDTTSPTVIKTIASTDQGFTTGASVAIGETITYTLTFRIPEGLSKDVILQDLIQANSEGELEILSAQITSTGHIAGISAGEKIGVLSDRGGSNNDAAIKDTATFSLGDITNAADGLEDGNDLITVTVVALAKNVAKDARNDTLDNTGSISVLDGDAPAGPRVVATSPISTVTIVEPRLTLTKTVTPVADADDVVTYTVTLSNASGSNSARAHDLVITDLMNLLGTDATFVNGSVHTGGSAAGAVIARGNGDGDGLNGLDTDVQVALAMLDPGQTLTVTFDAHLNGHVVASSYIPNTVTATASSLPGVDADERGYSLNASASVQVLGTSVSKTVSATDKSDTGTGQLTSLTDLKIGETATFDITVTLPEGNNTNFRIEDLLPDLRAGEAGRLVYVANSATIVSIGSSLTANAPTITATNDYATGNTTLDKITFTFGDVFNLADNIQNAGDTITVRLQAVLTDIAQNANGDVLTNSAIAVSGGVSGAASTVSVETVEPVLLLDKTSDHAPGQVLDAGAEITYTIRVHHAANSHLNAYDLNISDVIPADLALVAGSIQAAGATIMVGAGGAISITSGELDLGQELVITYKATVKDSATPGESLVNTAIVTYDNEPGAGGRAGTPDDGVVTDVVALTPDIVKTITATGFNSTTGSNLAIGETVTYMLTGTVGEGTQHLVLTDTLPNGMTLIGTPVLSNWDGSMGSAPSPVFSQTGQVLKLDFGTITNVADNVVGTAGDTFTVTFTAQVTGTGLTAGTILNNTAKIETYAPGPGTVGLASDTDSASATVVRPVLTITKATPFTTGDAGDVATYTVTIKHAPGSTGPAYDVVVSDLLAAGLVLVGTPTTTAGTLNTAGGQIGLTLSYLATSSGDVVITYQAKLANTVVNAESITNTATLAYKTAPAFGPDLTGSAHDTVSVAIPNSVQKVLSGTDNAMTAGSDVAPGELVTWQIKVTLGEGTQHISLTDHLPTGVTYVGASVLDRGGVAGPAVAINQTGQDVTFDFGNVVNTGDNNAATGVMILQVQARVGTVPVNGTVLTNTATLLAATPALPNTPYDTDIGTNAVTVVKAALGDQVFLDTNGNGIHDAGEAGVAGLEVQLLSTTGTVMATTHTAPDGTYGFANLAPGDYQVKFVTTGAQMITLANQGLNDTKDSDAAQNTGITGIVTLVAGQTDLTVDAGIYLPVTIGDRAFVDVNANGIQDAGDPGLSGVTVTLLDGSGMAIAGKTTTTDVNGDYLFEDLAPGSYGVQFTAPVGYVITPQNIGNDGADSDIDVTTGKTTSSFYTSGTTDLTLDGGFYIPAKLGDYAFLDMNADGIQDAGDKPLAGVKVTLLNAAGDAIGPVVFTDVNGAYEFTGLKPGDYRVKMEGPALTFTSPKDATGDALDSDLDANGFSDVVTLVSGSNHRDLDGGFYYKTKIGDFVWDDINGDGIQQIGEPGVAGVTVRLLDGAGTVLATATTDGNGYYLFQNRNPGTYIVAFVKPVGYEFTHKGATPNVFADSDADPTSGRGDAFLLGGGDDDLTRDAGLYRPATLSGDVWLDADRNGIHANDEAAVRGITVQLLDAAGLFTGRTTVTDANGHYGFGGLRPGTYGVAFMTPAGLAFTTQDVGGNEAVDSDANTVTGASSWTPFLVSGGSDNRGDAGLIYATGSTCQNGQTIDLGAGDQSFPGTPDNDNVFGNSGNDAINGLDGDDCLKGGDGNDAITGGNGDDEIHGGNGDDNVQGQDGDDLITGGAGNDVGEGGNGNDVLFGGDGDDNMQGEGGDDVLFGGAGADILTGNAGNDWVSGGSGNDTLQGADGDDVVIGGTDNGTAGLVGGRIVNVTVGDRLEGNGGADRFIYRVGDGVDQMLDFKPGEGDTLTIYGYSAPLAMGRINGLITVYFGPNDAIQFNDYPGAHVDTLTLPGMRFEPNLAQMPGSIAANDPAIPLRIAASVAAFYGSEGDESAIGSHVADYMAGNGGNDWLLGGDGDDNMIGGAGDDALFGGTGNDVLRPAPGNDYVDGGSGYDNAVLDWSGFRGASHAALPDGNFRLDSAEGIDLFRNVEQITFVDGRLSFDTNGAPAEVVRLYQAALGRDADQGGLNYWIEAVEHGTPLASLASSFLGSSEFATRFGTPDNAGFVDQLYQNVLGRAGDAGGVAFWTGVLNSGGSRADLLVQFSESPENREHTAGIVANGIWDLNGTSAQIARLYDTVFDRLPDLGGLHYWTTLIEGGSATLASAADAFAASGEFLTTYGALDDAGFVSALYDNALDRAATPGDIAYWTGVLAGPADRADLVLDFSESAEHQALTAANITNADPHLFGILFA